MSDSEPEVDNVRGESDNEWEERNEWEENMPSSSDDEDDQKAVEKKREENESEKISWEAAYAAAYDSPETGSGSETENSNSSSSSGDETEGEYAEEEDEEGDPILEFWRMLQKNQSMTLSAGVDGTIRMTLHTVDVITYQIPIAVTDGKSITFQLGQSTTNVKWTVEGRLLTINVVGAENEEPRWIRLNFEDAVFFKMPPFKAHSESGELRIELEPFDGEDN